MNSEKKYKEALNRAKILIEKLEDNHIKGFIYHIFPELLESNEERIKREILELVSIAGNGNQYEEIKDWLEKQGEKSTIIDIDKMVDKFARTEFKNYGVPSIIEVDAYRKGIEDVLEKKSKGTQLVCKHVDISLKDLENLFQALPEKIFDVNSHQIYELSIYHYDGKCVVDYVGELDHSSLYTFDGDTLYDAIEKTWNWLRKDSTGA